MKKTSIMIGKGNSLENETEAHSQFKETENSKSMHSANKLTSQDLKYKLIGFLIIKTNIIEIQ